MARLEAASPVLKVVPNGSLGWAVEAAELTDQIEALCVQEAVLNRHHPGFALTLTGVVDLTPRRLL